MLHRTQGKLHSCPETMGLWLSPPQWPPSLQTDWGLISPQAASLGLQLSLPQTVASSVLGSVRPAPLEFYTHHTVILCHIHGKLQPRLVDTTNVDYHLRNHTEASYISGLSWKKGHSIYCCWNFKMCFLFYWSFQLEDFCLVLFLWFISLCWMSHSYHEFSITLGNCLLLHISYLMLFYLSSTNRHPTSHLNEEDFSYKTHSI